MHSRVLLSGIVLLSTLSSLGCSSSDKAGTENTETGVEYLAVGDSIAYGDNGFIDHTEAAPPDPSALSDRGRQ